jgi:hypothetical protein
MKARQAGKKPETEFPSTLPPERWQGFLFVWFVICDLWRPASAGANSNDNESE